MEKQITVKDVVILKRQAIASKNVDYINKVNAYIKSIIAKQSETAKIALQQALLTTTY